MSGFSVRLTHKIMAIGIVGLIGLLAFGAIYQVGSWSQDASRAVAKSAGRSPTSTSRSRSKCLRRGAARRIFSSAAMRAYAKSHSELVVKIDRDFGRLEDLTKAADLGALHGEGQARA